MRKDEVQEIAFQIIAYAGDAFTYFNQAIDSAEQGDMEKVKKQFQKGTDELKRAHDAQTSLLTYEANGQEISFSIIMVHAQDHLTMAIFAQRMAKHFIKLWKERRSEDV
jgi:cellobiose-specific phosphotransferase system component IIA